MSLARLGTTLALLGALAGCDSSNPYERSDSGPLCPDCAADDASIRDAGVAPGLYEDGALCFDEIDNDSDEQTDCEETSCSTSNVVCCIGSARDECCATSPRTLELTLDACSDGPADACLAGDPTLQLFGAELPVIEGSALVPQGGAGHGGVAIGAPIDLRSMNLSFSADLAVPAPAMRCTDCVDGAGIAILGELPDPGERAIVRFGVLATSSRDEVVVLVADEVVARTTLPVGSASITLTLDVQGTAVAHIGEETIATIEGLSLPEQAWLAVFGQNTNRAAGIEAVRVTGASVSTRACDVPGALARRATPVVPWSGATGWTPREVRSPSVVAWDEGETRHAVMAFSHAGAIHLAQRTGFGEFRHAEGDPGPVAFALPAGVVSVQDPSLLLEGTQLVLYFVGVGDDGVRRVWKTTGEPGYSQTFGDPAMVLDPTSVGLADIDGIAVVPSPSGWSMVARVQAGQEQRIVRFVSSDSLFWLFHGSSLQAATLRSPRTGDLFAFDRDEVAAPALVTFPDARGNVVTRLYYAGRRGTRWRIGMLASSDGVFFRPVGAVLEPAGGFDALGVMDPAPVVEDGVLRVYYAGTDGSSYRIGLSGPAGTVGE